MYIIQSQNNRTLKQHHFKWPLSFSSILLGWLVQSSWIRYSTWTFINLPGWCSAEGAAPSEKTAAFKRWKCDGFACELTEENTSKFSWKKQMCSGFRPADSNPSDSSWLSSWVSGRDAVQRVWISSTKHTHAHTAVSLSAVCLQLQQTTKVHPLP